MEEGEQQYRQMTTKPIPNLIMSLSIPTIASMLITNIYNLVDAFIIWSMPILLESWERVPVQRLELC